jgi:hypothetical protein
MSQTIFDPQLLCILTDIGKRLSPASHVPPCANDAWMQADGTALHFEQNNQELLIILRMPERHLDAAQLMQLLMLCDQDWPLPLAASIHMEDAEALLLTRTWIATLDSDLLSQAILMLQQARRRWLQAPRRTGAAARMHSGAAP